MQGNGEQKGGLKDRLRTWRIKKKKEKRQKQLKKQEQKEKERQLKIKNSQVFSNQTGRTQSEKKNFLMICVGFFAALFESPTKKSEKREIKRFAKNKEDAPVALLSLKRDIKNYTDSLNQCLSLLGKEIDTVMDVQEFDRIQSLLDEFEEGYKQVLEKYEMIKDRHRIREEETVLGLTKSKEVILDDSMSEEAKQSILASTAFITARLEEIQEKLTQVKTELEVKEKEWNIEPPVEEKEEKKVIATIHTGDETIEITEKPFHKKASIARPQPAIDFLKKQNEMMKEYEERIDSIHRISPDEVDLETLEAYLKELTDMNHTLDQSLSSYKQNQEKYNIHSLIAFEDVRSFDRYRLTVSDVKIREILRHTTGEKETIETYIKDKKQKLEKQQEKEEFVKQEVPKKEEVKMNQVTLQTEEIEQAMNEIKKIISEQEQTLQDFHTTLSKSSIRVRKESHFSRFKHLMSSFTSMAFGVIGVFAFNNPLMKILTGGIALNGTVKNLRRAIRPETIVEMLNTEQILKSIKTKQDCIDHTIDVYSSTLTEIEWLKEDFEHEFKAYESIHANEYQSIMNQIETLKQTVEKELTVAENMKANTKEEKQKVLTLSKK